MDKDEALKLALEALDNLLYWDNGKSDYDQAREAITAIQQALSAPVQEPVAWVTGLHAGRCVIKTINPAAILPVGIALYTTPPAQPAPMQPVSGVVLRDGYPTLIQDKHIKETDHRLCILPTAPPAQPAPVQTVAWRWHQAPIKTQWGHEMVVADLAIDKDNTVSVYCERDQTAKVEAMFNPPAAQRQWVGLSQDDLDAMFSNTIKGKKLVNWVARSIEAKLKEKNT